MLRIHSDLHLESFLGQPIQTLSEKFVPITPDDHAHSLVLAGDICSVPEKLVQFIKEMSYRFKRVFFVPGNHEFYRNVMSEWDAFITQELSTIPNVYFATSSEVKQFVVEDVTYILATLWGDGGFTVVDQMAIQYSLNDFRLIESTPGDAFSVNHMRSLYQFQSAQIRQYVELAKGKSVVITHHLPSRQLVSERFAIHGEGINGGFVGACDNWLQYVTPSLWIHGHTHDKIVTNVFGMDVRCNPTGYRGEWNNGFSDGGVMLYEI